MNYDDNNDENEDNDDDEYHHEDKDEQNEDELKEEEEIDPYKVNDITSDANPKSKRNNWKLLERLTKKVSPIAKLPGANFHWQLVHARRSQTDIQEQAR